MNTIKKLIFLIVIAGLISPTQPSTLRNAIRHSAGGQRKPVSPEGRSSAQLGSAGDSRPGSPQSHSRPRSPARSPGEGSDASVDDDTTVRAPKARTPVTDAATETEAPASTPTDTPKADSARRADTATAETTPANRKGFLRKFANIFKLNTKKDTVPSTVDTDDATAASGSAATSSANTRNKFKRAASAAGSASAPLAALGALGLAAANTSMANNMQDELKETQSDLETNVADLQEAINQKQDKPK